MEMVEIYNVRHYSIVSLYNYIIWICAGLKNVLLKSGMLWWARYVARMETRKEYSFWWRNLLVNGYLEMGT